MQLYEMVLELTQQSSHFSWEQKQVILDIKSGSFVMGIGLEFRVNWYRGIRFLQPVCTRQLGKHYPLQEKGGSCNLIDRLHNVGTDWFPPRCLPTCFVGPLDSLLPCPSWQPSLPLPLLKVIAYQQHKPVLWHPDGVVLRFHRTDIKGKYFQTAFFLIIPLGFLHPSLFGSFKRAVGLKALPSFSQVTPLSFSYILPCSYFTNDAFTNQLIKLYFILKNLYSNALLGIFSLNYKY